ncbi:MAG: 3-phosphoshikimate 1-carboxyvinyltransferase [Dehalococcoidia bacterium]
MDLSLLKPQSFKGEIKAPGDKSIAHRALILNSLGSGQASISNFPRAQDTIATLNVMKTLGMDIVEKGTDSRGISSNLIIKSRGINSFKKPSSHLDAQNSGTLMRLLLGVLAGSSISAVVSGDSSLNKRPMGRIVQPLKLMGANIAAEAGDEFPPINVIGTELTGINYDMPIASAQLKSALLIAGLVADGKTQITEPNLSRDHTENMLTDMGIHLDKENISNRIIISPGIPNMIDVEIPSDFSSAAPWIVGGLIHKDSEVVIKDVGINETRTGLLDVLQAMGATVSIEKKPANSKEFVADIMVSSSGLKGIEIQGEIIPRLIDEIPLIAVAATQAEGTTIIRDARELRVKESDRIKNTVIALNRLGARVEEQDDGMVIYGKGNLKGGTLDSSGDHRLAIAWAVASLVSDGEVVIQNSEVTEVSYPNFWSDFLAIAVKN